MTSKHAEASGRDDRRDGDFERFRPLFEAARSDTRFDRAALHRVKTRLAASMPSARFGMTTTSTRGRWVLLAGVSILLAAVAFARMAIELSRPERMRSEERIEPPPRLPMRLVLSPAEVSPTNPPLPPRRVGLVTSGPPQLIEPAAEAGAAMEPSEATARGATIPVDLEAIRSAQKRAAARTEYVPRPFREP